MEEKVDILDGKGTIVSTCTKKEAHEKGLLHKTVVAEVINSKGEWLLVKQAPDRQDANQYVSPVGGHVSAHESEEEALCRETFEELGMNNITYKRVGEDVFSREVLGRKENHLFVVFEIFSDETPILNHESVSYKRFTPAELKRMISENSQQLGDAFHFLARTVYKDYFA